MYLSHLFLLYWKPCTLHQKTLLARKIPKRAKKGKARERYLRMGQILTVQSLQVGATGLRQMMLVLGAGRRGFLHSIAMK